MSTRSPAIVKTTAEENQKQVGGATSWSGAKHRHFPQPSYTCLLTRDNENQIKAAQVSLNQLIYFMASNNNRPAVRNIKNRLIYGQILIHLSMAVLDGWMDG